MPTLTKTNGKKSIANGKTRVVHQGDEINGMKVALVTPDRVQFTAGGDAEDLILKVAPGPKTTLAAAPPPPGAPGAPAGGAARAAQAGRAQPAAVGQLPREAEQTQLRNARAARRSGRAAGAGAQGDAGAAIQQGNQAGFGGRGSGRPLAK